MSQWVTERLPSTESVCLSPSCCSLEFCCSYNVLEPSCSYLFGHIVFSLSGNCLFFCLEVSPGRWSFLQGGNAYIALCLLSSSSSLTFVYHSQWEESYFSFPRCPRCRFAGNWVFVNVSFRKSSDIKGDDVPLAGSVVSHVWKEIFFITRRPCSSSESSRDLQLVHFTGFSLAGDSYWPVRQVWQWRTDT